MASTTDLKIRGKLLIDFTLQGYNIKVPQKHLQAVLNTSTSMNDLAVFNVAKSGVLVSIIDYICQDNVIYVSEEVFSLVKHYRTAKMGYITIERFCDYVNGSTVLLKPMSTKFLKVMDQVGLLQNHICHNIRLLYPKQEFSVFAEELNEYIKFQVVMTNDTRYRVILAIDTDLTVDFDCVELLERMKLPEPFRDTMSMFIPGDGMRTPQDYVDNGLYNGNKLGMLTSSVDYSNADIDISDDKEDDYDYDYDSSDDTENEDLNEN